MKHNKKNYILGIINGTLFRFAFSITGSETILPVFVSTLTSSGFLIGLSGAMQTALWPLPQIFMAHYLEGKTYKKFVYTYTAYIRTFAMLLMGLSILWFPPYILPLFMCLLFIYLIAGGMSGISFMEIVGKTIAPKYISSFWAFRQAGGGVFAILGGLFVKYTLSHYDYPLNYAILFLSSSIIVGIALISFILSDEPPSVGQIKNSNFFTFFKNGINVLKKDKKFIILFSYRVLMAIAMGPMPFYAIFAIQKLSLQIPDIGFLISIQMAGLILSNIIWDRISKSFSTKYIMIITALFVLLQPPLSYLSLFVGTWLMYIVFFLIGCSMAGIRVGYLSYLLIISPDNKRPTYIGFMNTFIAPALFYPMINGLIIDYFSFTPTFIVSIVCSFAAMFLIFHIDK